MILKIAFNFVRRSYSPDVRNQVNQEILHALHTLFAEQDITFCRIYTPDDRSEK